MAARGIVAERERSSDLLGESVERRTNATAVHEAAQARANAEKALKHDADPDTRTEKWKPLLALDEGKKKVEGLSEGAPAAGVATSSPAKLRDRTQRGERTL